MVPVVPVVVVVMVVMGMTLRLMWVRRRVRRVVMGRLVVPVVPGVLGVRPARVVPGAVASMVRRVRVLMVSPATWVPVVLVAMVVPVVMGRRVLGVLMG